MDEETNESINRLEEMIIEEVSIVHSGANRKPLLVVKSESNLDDKESTAMSDDKKELVEETKKEEITVGTDPVDKTDPVETDPVGTEKEETEVDVETEKEETEETEETEKEETAVDVEVESETEKEDEVTEDTEKDTDQEKGSADIAGSLQSVIDQLQTGEPVSEAIVSALQRVIAMLPKQSEPTEDRSEESEKSDTTDSNEVEKAGKKMARKRRKELEKAMSQFKDGIELLSQIFNEVIPEEQRGTWKSTKVETLEKSLKEEKKLDILKGDLTDIEKRLAEKKDELRDIQTEISKEMKRPISKKSLDIEGVSESKNSSERFVWLSDLNDNR